MLTKGMVEVLFDCLKNIDFRQKGGYCYGIKSLPLFESVDGSLVSIEGKDTYIWDQSVSTAGYHKWKQHCEAVFLTSSGAWKILGCDQLKIGSLSAEDIYCRYIFKTFHYMNEEERYKHLDHIKTFLSFSNEFVEELKCLKCIGIDAEALRPISEFCDHSQSIFTTFEKKFRFLPECFVRDWKKWRDFFQKLNLKQTVTKREFYSLCSVAAEEHENPEKASKVLLDFLLSRKGSLKDEKFLSQVSSIKFVPAEQLPELSWIKSPRQSANPGRQVKRNGKVTQLIKLSGAALVDHKMHLWTVKPIVKLSEGGEFLARLGVCSEVTEENVLENIRNISSMRKFTDLELFENYPISNQPPENAISLTEVMKCQFQFLQNRMADLQIDFSVLKDTPCIPVPFTADKGHTQSWKVVLVKSSVVVREGVQAFHPFLHSVPVELNPCLGLLMKIGVCNSVSVKHCQRVLKIIFERLADQRLDEKSKTCVVKTLKHLWNLLKTPGNHSQLCPPLYLPSSKGTLALSTDLLYPDTSSYLGNVHLSSSFIKLVPKREYGFSEREFCQALPQAVRPDGMSKVCSQKVCEDCGQPVAPCSTHSQLQKTLTMRSELSCAINAIIKHHTSDYSNDIQDLLQNFITSIKIITVEKLQTVVSLKDTGEEIGRLDLAFHFQYDESESSKQLCLYLDSKKTILIENIIKALSYKLLKLIGQQNPHLSRDDLSEILVILVSVLRLQTPSEIQCKLSEVGIPYDFNSSSVDEVTFELGEEISTAWHHRLDQSLDNVFHPGELVGYEIEEQRIIFAQIMHPLLPDGGNLDSVKQISMSYRIFISSEDDEGTEVSILQLYKFLGGTESQVSSCVDERVLVPFEGAPNAVQLTGSRMEDLARTIETLKDLLEEIWNLSEEEQKRAIRRLYLKWHPDKNPDNPDLAEEVFKFLTSEITKRMKGEFECEDLNEIAKRHKRSYQREQHFSESRQEKSHSSRHSGGTAKTESDGASETSRTTTFSDLFFGSQSYRPPCDPEEGKRWLKQAEANFRSLTALLEVASQDKRVCGDVCFMAHQVAEKALKGGKFFVCGLDKNSLRTHHLCTHAYGLQSERPGDTQDLVTHTAPLEKYYLEPRYPNRWTSVIVPAEQYDYQTAEAAKSHAEKVRTRHYSEPSIALVVGIAHSYSIILAKAMRQ